MQRGIIALAAAVCAFLALPALAVAAPANDNFANREVLSGALPIAASGTNVEATAESGEEVSVFAAGHSVWFEWEAPSSGWFTIGACDTDFDPVIGIFTGTELASLSRVVSGNAAEGPHCPYGQREYSFEATAGTDYVIAVDGNGFSLPEGPPPDDQGGFELGIEATPPPANDDFEGATTLTGGFAEGGSIYGLEAFGYNWAATLQTGEPEHEGEPGGASVWYSWTAPASGAAALYPCCGPGFLVGLYTGGSLSALSPVATTPGPPGGAVTATVAAGTTYRIAIDGARDESSGEPFQSSFSFRISMQDPVLPSAPPGASPAPISQPDVSAPETTITKRFLTIGRAKFWFGSSEPGGFLCRLGKRPFKPCGSPRTYKNLGSGRHAFRVKAVDAAGNVDPTPAIARFKVAARAQRSR